MQKIVSFFLLGISLILLFLSTTNRLSYAIRSFPPYCSVQSSFTAQEQTLAGADYSILSKKGKPDGMHAKAYCLLDAGSKRTLLGSNENEQMPMASTTKIMTCILALENGKMDSKVKVSSYAASMPDVQLNMQAGDTFYLKDLLYSLMLESHNDTAVAIAEHIGGTVEGFAELMNQKAERLGCTNTNFVTPNGLDDKNHYTTARELCIIASYAIQNTNFLEIIQTPSYQFHNCKGTRNYAVNNHDAFLTRYSGAIGIKTGFTGTAGYCFCGAAKRNGKTLITSVLACGWPPNKGYKWADTKKLMDYGFANFESVTLKKPEPPKTLPVTGGTDASLPLRRTSYSEVSMMLCQNDTVTTKVNLPQTLAAPIRQGDIIGYEEYYLNNELIYQFPITAKNTIPKRNLSYYQDIIKKLFLFAMPET